MTHDEQCNIEYFHDQCAHYKIDPRFIRYLNPQYKKLAVLRCVPGYSFQKIAEVMKGKYNNDYHKWTVHGVAGMHYTAMRKLREFHENALALNLDMYIPAISADEMLSLIREEVE